MVWSQCVSWADGMMVFAGGGAGIAPYGIAKAALF
jgi:hypothetical protein